MLSALVGKAKLHKPDAFVRSCKVFTGANPVDTIYLRFQRTPNRASYYKL